MPAPVIVVLLAVTTLVVVTAALCHEVLVLRARQRRDLDCYLRWLLQHATGPLNVSRRLRPY